MNKLVSLIAGIIFGIGLATSEMINPEKVLGFLNIFENWDPSLAFVMMGALVVSSPLFHIIKNREKPIFAEKFNYSNKKSINSRLIIGSVLFGAGWGLIGLCPGPAISSIALLNIQSIIFVVAMFVGFYLVKFINSDNKNI
ncbi:YeeE/YedE family protein [Candidatus Pelagibacter sp.]|nr:YeeE/YedE family protein [Candidatus Pelagibacter sp.]|tara:strand:- start:121 stop:543 length:423 start_codon:yes stop_codon:yes gene_type:complete